MPPIDAGIQQGCVILPFVSPKHSAEDVKTTTLAALVAVTIIHDADMCPEERLIQIIEQSGEAEVLDSDDAFSQLGLEELDTSTGYDLDEPVNDNNALTTV